MTLRPRIILGPPGTGKTTTLISHVKDELGRGTPPDRIGYVSFTRRAAHEAVTRSCEAFNINRAALPHFSTLHSLCFKQLGLRRSEVFSHDKLQEFASYARVRITGHWSDDGSLTGYAPGDRILFMENLARIRNLPLETVYNEISEGISWREVCRVVAALNEFKAEYNLLDFTDMLIEFIKHGPDVRLDSLFVDESQDLSHIQWLVIKKLMKRCKHLAVAGDDDQAIYRWAGADVDIFIDMKGDIQVLDQSFRVPERIQEVAVGILDDIEHRREKNWHARTGGPGEVQYAYGFGRTDCSEGETLILARNTYIIQGQIIPDLRRRGYLYEYNGHNSIKPSLIDAIYSWEALRRGKRITISDARKVYAQMRAGHGYTHGFKMLPGREDDEKVTIQNLHETGGLLRNDEWFAALHLTISEINYIRAVLSNGEDITAKPRIMLSTIHGSKGGEADHVIVMKEMAARTHREMLQNRDDEARVWYVATTRARERLTIVQSQQNDRMCPWI